MKLGVIKVFTTSTTQQTSAFLHYNTTSWGKPRNPYTWQASENVVFKATARGYTLHEHIALFDIINMNGRLYDAKLGRMLSPDNYIQAPTSTQSYNRYSYAFNNPLKYVDPDGNWAQSGYRPSTSSMGKGADSYWNIMKVIAEHDAYQAEINRTNERIAYEANRRGWESLFAQIETAIENGGSSLGISMDVLKLTDVSPYGAGIGGFLADPKGNYTSIITTKTEGLGLIVPKSFDISGWFGDGEASGGGGWDSNGDGKLQKTEADYRWLNGGGDIYVDNSKINWAGLKIPASAKVGKVFSINTTQAFLKLPYETAATYGGTSFILRGANTVQVVDQLYHYQYRPNNSAENMMRNFMNWYGKPDGQGTDYMIHYINPLIIIK